MSVLPASVRVGLWATAAYTGQVRLVDVMALALPDVHHVTGDVDCLQLWHDFGERAVLVALPRPGDLSGMPRGSAEFVAAATCAGECVYVPGMGGALVPTIETFGPEGDQGTQATWTAYDTEPMPVHTLEALSLAEVELRLRQELMGRTRDIDDLDAKPWAGRPLRQLADDCVGSGRWGLPDGVPRRARAIIEMAAMVGTTTELGLRVESSALTSAVAERRRAMLTSLQAVAYSALANAATVAALSIAGLRAGRRDG